MGKGSGKGPQLQKNYLLIHLSNYLARKLARYKQVMSTTSTG